MPWKVSRCRGGSAIPSDELKALNNARKQIDASFDLGEILVIAECKAVARSIAFDRGEPAAIEKRLKVIEVALTEADDNARWLRDNPRGFNYDITKYKSIMPIGVTPFFKEFIPSLCTRYWITKTLPRVLTPDELRERRDFRWDDPSGLCLESQHCPLEQAPSDSSRYDPGS